MRASLLPVFPALLLPVIQEMDHVCSLVLPAIWEIRSCECIVTGGHLGTVSLGYLGNASCTGTVGPGHAGNGSCVCNLSPGHLINGS